MAMRPNLCPDLARPVWLYINLSGLNENSIRLKFEKVDSDKANIHVNDKSCKDLTRLPGK